MPNIAQNYSLEEMDRQSLIHPATSIADHLRNGPTIIAGGSGVRVKDRHGRELIDCGAGLWCVNIGYGRAELGEAAAQATLYGATMKEAVAHVQSSGESEQKQVLEKLRGDVRKDLESDLDQAKKSVRDRLRGGPERN